MLTNIKLRNVKCFDDLCIDLSSLNILAGINGSGKSTLIQSILLVAQSENYAALNLNGPLAEIGDYSDLLHEVAEDDGAHISITVNGNTCRWGYPESAELSDKTSEFELPRIDGDIDSIPNFDDFLYISAERWGPRNNVSLNLNLKNENWLGKHGEYTIPVLGALSLRNRKDKLNEHDLRRHETQSSELILDNIISWMGEISPNIAIDATIIREAASAYSSFKYSDDDSNSKSFKAANVGFGLSYALSVVTALLISPKGSLLIIENPEAHIHPRGQSKLGQLIGLAAISGVQIVTETHSEHIINGARILVRKGVLPSSEMNILYFQRDIKKKKSICEKLEMNEAGQIIKWPVGFFDQQAIDMRTLMTGV